jgi:hypothetical protein
LIPSAYFTSFFNLSVTRVGRLIEQRASRKLSGLKFLYYFASSCVLLYIITGGVLLATPICSHVQLARTLPFLDRMRSPQASTWRAHVTGTYSVLICPSSGPLFIIIFLPSRSLRSVPSRSAPLTHIFHMYLYSHRSVVYK